MYLIFSLKIWGSIFTWRWFLWWSLTRSRTTLTCLMRHRWASFNTVLWSFVSFLVFFVLSIRKVGCFLLADGFYGIKWHSLVTNTKLFQPSPIHTNKWEDYPVGIKPSNSLRSWILMTSRESKLLVHRIQERCITRCLVRHTFETTGTSHTISDRCKKVMLSQNCSCLV